MMTYFKNDVAVKIGVNGAVMLNVIAEWVKVEGREYTHDGKGWTRSSVKAFCSLFPFLSRQNIRTIFNHFIEEGYLLEGNYNEDKRDATKWYTLSDKGYMLLGGKI